MGGIEVIALFALVVMAPVLAAQAYVLVWILGPAIRRAGRRWEEGRQAAGVAIQTRLREAYDRGYHEGVIAPRPAGQLPGPPVDVVAPTGLADTPKYTITGRRLS